MLFISLANVFPLRIRRLLGLALLATLAACGGDGDTPAPEPTLDQKIGQMVMMGFHGTSAADPGVQTMQEHFREGRLGGVVFYRYNIIEPEQVQALNSAFASASTQALPVLRAIDQEGGRVQRLSAANGFRSHPSAEAVAGTLTPAQAYELYRDQARLVRDAGFNFNLAPVADLRGIPGDPAGDPGSPVIGGLERAFSSDPATVALYAGEAVRAHRAEGVLTSLKHYPGHGLARGDSHRGLVDITDDYQPIEREPFRALIGAGLADSVMGAHLVHRGVDAEFPVTLSSRYLGPWLREQDGFGGVIVTDDLHMGAIQRYHDFEEIVIRAIQAGNDLLIFSNNPAAAPEVEGFEPRHDLPLQVIAVVRAAIERGELTEARIEWSYQRLQTLRSRAAG
ncbi:MAG: glycoside hydrolase family 3 N-terminal domain-containing protein [Pigmentiphaga sp.]